MAALVQSFPSQQSSAPVSLMQPRSQPSTGALHGAAQAQLSHQPARYSNNRGYSTAPVATYAFTSTPSLATKPQSAPGPSKPSVGGKPDETRQSYTSLDSINPEAALRAPPSTSRSMDDTTLQQGVPRPQQPRPLSTSSFPQNQMQTALPSPREKPDRYKRVNRNSYIGTPAASAQPNGPGTAAVAAVYAHPSRANSSPNVNGGQNGVVKAPFIGDYEGQLRSQSVDDIHTLGRPSPQGSTNHGRRRSVGPGSITTESFQNFLRQELAQTGNGSVKGQATGGPKSPVVAEFKPPMRPGSRRTGSTDSSASGSSSRASSNRNSVASNASNPAQPPANSPPHEIPPRSSSADVTKRMTAPSPLSKSAIEPEVAKPTSSGSGSEFKSTAAEHLNAVSDGQKKGVKNRLRRAFSFGSAAELRKASAANHHDAAARARSRQELFQQEQDVEQARIARRQEAAGLGESIYSGQGNFFAGSTDNISVSSTASSASIMIRKMGKGIKRSSRSLVGIFRPKSSHGSESGNTPLSPTSPPSTGPVSMITVEAERERVNVNANVTEHVGGGTGFPKLERNSLEMPPTIADDQERRGSVASSSRGRRSIVGGEQERAEILAAVRKGILKQRSGSASPVVRPAQGQQVPEVPQITGAENQRPSSGQREGGDYFMPAPTFNTQSHSAPTSPMTHQKYNVSFSPRITFHDTWPSQEYDRRGEVATCNRLTPVLAQQIKEELNTFKMEMEVHEQSKMYTHFF